MTVGIDTSGVSLHKRGYREVSGKAPITETLAAALIMLTPWRKDRILVDPFCGSGTFPIEAAMMAANIAPGMNRSFTAEDWTNLTKDSVLFHEKLGYTMVGTFHQCGYKFHRWYDMVWMEKFIGEHRENQPDIIPFPKLKLEK